MMLFEVGWSHFNRRGREGFVEEQESEFVLYRYLFIYLFSKFLYLTTNLTVNTIIIPKE